MSASVVYALAFYAATAILVIGVVRKIVQYAKTPAPYSSLVSGPGFLAGCSISHCYSPCSVTYVM
jgi:hypothetical protein